MKYNDMRIQLVRHSKKSSRLIVPRILALHRNEMNID
jgi:hypothetical protein